MLLSSCLLSFNSAETLEKTILSVLNQDLDDYELIISDDHSNDNSWEVITRYASQNQKIIPIRTPDNLGMAGNANFAAKRATGKYITILHHDDEYSSDMFSMWINLMEANSNVGLCFNDYSSFELKVKSVHKEQLKRKYSTLIKGHEFLTKDLLRYWGCSVWGTYATRKKIWDDLGGLNTSYGLLADVDLTMRVASKWDIGYIEKPLIDLKRSKPTEYPIDYNEFSWKRIFILFDIHANNINRDNFPDFLIYKMKRFIFRNKVSFEIVKWHIYALVKSKKQIIISFPEKCEHEYLYSKVIRSIIKILPAR